MLVFCPHCANILTVSNTSGGGGNRLECRTCPFEYSISQPLYSRREFKRKAKDDIFGGPERWKDAQTTKIKCAVDDCPSEEAAFYQVQIRSADEPMTNFYKCIKCGKSWRD